MYLQYFGLDKDPFTISPDPAFLYPSPQHRQALAHLKYGLDREGGFILLTGEVGTGKTTLTRLLLDQLPGNIRVAYILNTKLNSEDVLASICQDLSLEHEPGASIKTLTDLIYRDLLDTHSKGKKTLLVLEEAQNLDPDVLETLRLLTNLETNTTKLLHILLVGQPELQELLARNELRQLNQRVVSRFHIEPLDLQETHNYLNHRLRHAGSKRPAFEPSAVKQLHKLSGGIPRMLNLLAERSLLGAYATNANLVTAKIVLEARQEVLGNSPSSSTTAGQSSFKLILALGIALILVVAVGLFLFIRQPEEPAAQIASPQSAPVVTQEPVQQQVVEVVPGQMASQPPSQPVQAEVIQSDRPAVQSTSDTPVAIEPAITSANQAAITQAGQDQASPRVVAQPQPQSQLQPEPVVVAKTERVREYSAPGKNTYVQLLELWGVNVENVFNQRNFCLIAASNALKCRIDEGLDLNDLAQINRPGLVTLPGERDNISLFLVNAFDGNDIILSNSSSRFSMPKADFVDLWDGGFVYIWRPPAEFVRTLYPGARDSAMTRWLQQQLSVVFDDYEYVINGGTYSQPIVRAVARFQSQQGLEADGLLGARTILRLMDQNEDLPRLDRPAFVPGQRPDQNPGQGAGNF